MWSAQDIFDVTKTPK